MLRLFFFVSLLFVSAHAASADETNHSRVPWTTSRVVGSPDPPLPYSTEPAYLDIEWKRPIYAKTEPGTENLVVVEQGGEKDRPTRLLRVDSNDPLKAETLLEIEQQLVYGIEFHPDYASNGQLFTFGNGPVGEPERKNLISRFQVAREDGQPCDPRSQQTIIEWRSMGHDGGELAFGADDMLYISSGDGSTDSDTWLSAQDLSSLLGGVLRIDVDHPAGDGRPYSIPRDNPFLDYEGARGELWAFGLRNPWRLSADRKSGQVWVGVNGQDLWETVHLVRRGENYGWSVYEGSHPFYPGRELGPVPVTPPTVEHHHREARSLTGGVVYRGSKHPELDGAYIYGDYSTGKIWGVKHDGKSVTWKAELADTTHQIAGFAIDPQGELLVVDHGGSLNRLMKAPPKTQRHPFPTRLSETGLFASTPEHQVASGVVPYEVNASAWHEGAEVVRYLAIPGEQTIGYRANRAWNLPDGTVLMQTLVRPGGPRIETRLLTKQQAEWVGYSYRWNDAQDDANLVTASGETIELPWEDGSQRTWQIPSRAECMSCHAREVGFTLGISHVQLAGSQLEKFRSLGLFGEEQPKLPEDATHLRDPYDESQPTELRARSWLHANCSHCHVRAGGGNSRMEMEYHKSLKDTNLISVRPQHATFGIGDARIVAPGSPERSVLWHRISRRGAGQMPPLVSTKVDQRASALIARWITSLRAETREFIRDWKVDDLLADLPQIYEKRSLETGKQLFAELACDQCHRFANAGGGAGPKLSGIASRQNARELLASIVDPSATITRGFETTVLLLDDGRTVTGRIESETEQQFFVQSTESFGKRIEIAKSRVEERLPSKSSLMPSGLLNTLTREQILDLLAWILRGESESVDAQAE